MDIDDDLDERINAKADEIRAKLEGLGQLNGLALLNYAALVMVYYERLESVARESYALNKELLAALKTEKTDHINDLQDFGNRADKAWDVAKGAMGKLEPVALLGAKFKEGRRLGAHGPIRKAIAKLLNSNQNMKNAELLTAIKEKPPKGWSYYDNRLGKYFEGKDNKSMTVARFNNICSEERRKLKQKITG